MTNSLRKIDSIMFRVNNLENAVKYYQEALGLIKVWEDAARKMVGLIFPDSDSEIVLHQDPSIKNPDFSFLVNNVTEFCEEYKKKGYQVETEPFAVRTGKFAVLKDLDGNQISIIDLTKFGGKPHYD